MQLKLLLLKSSAISLSFLSPSYSTRLSRQQSWHSFLTFVKHFSPLGSLSFWDTGFSWFFPDLQGFTCSVSFSGSSSSDRLYMLCPPGLHLWPSFSPNFNLSLSYFTPSNGYKCHQYVNDSQNYFFSCDGFKTCPQIVCCTSDQRWNIIPLPLNISQPQWLMSNEQRLIWSCEISETRLGKVISFTQVLPLSWDMHPWNPAPRLWDSQATMWMGHV